MCLLFDKCNSSGDFEVHHCGICQNVICSWSSMMYHNGKHQQYLLNAIGIYQYVAEIGDGSAYTTDTTLEKV